MINITGNSVFDLFIMQSQENKDKVFKRYAAGPWKYIDIALEECGFTRSDFTDSDWYDIEQYLSEEGDNIG